MSNWVSRNHYFDDYEEQEQPEWVNRMQRIEAAGWKTYGIGQDFIEYHKRNWICTVWMKEDDWTFLKVTA